MCTNITGCNFRLCQERMFHINPPIPRIINQHSQIYSTGECTGHCRNLNHRSRLSSHPPLSEGSGMLTLVAYNVCVNRADGIDSSLALRGFVSRDFANSQGSPENNKYLFTAKLLYMFRVSIATIIRST